MKLKVFGKEVKFKDASESEYHYSDYKDLICYYEFEHDGNHVLILLGEEDFDSTIYGIKVIISPVRLEVTFEGKENFQKNLDKLLEEAIRVFSIFK